MPTYGNASGNSGVVSYEEGFDWITVTFKDGSTYLYNDAVTGHATVEQMRRLAYAGQGLNSFITRVVRKSYAAKV